MTSNKHITEHRIAYITLGCKLNFAETATYERGFAGYGLKTVPWEDKADIYLVNTCSVTEHSDKKARNIIRKLHRLSPDAHIVVTGCYAELKRKEISEIEGVSLIFGAKEKSRVVAETMAMLENGKRLPDAVDASFKELSMAEEYREISKETMAAFSTSERTRAFLKVQDGCNNFCAYCTVPYARGNSRNLPICEIVREARLIAESGTKEIVLTGVNTGDFGRSTGESFLDLLKALNEVEGIERFRISSIEPNLITSEIIEWIASGTKFLPHFHIPLQVGNDLLLKAMGRKYDTALFAEKIAGIRKKMEKPGEAKVFFGIDVIVGLPGETDELFEETYRFLSEVIRPAFIHIFPYSKRPGTRAATMPGQVQDRIKTERVRRLEELCRKLNDEFVQDHNGMTLNVLWEDKDNGGMMYGYTENYIRAERAYDEALTGTIGQVTL